MKAPAEENYVIIANCIKLFWLKTEVERIEKTLKVVPQIAQQKYNERQKPYKPRISG